MMTRRWELTVISVVVLCSYCSALNMGLSELLRNSHVAKPAQKRYDENEGNPCPEPEKPFPCKSTSTCISMGYVCDENYDCEDGYDENPDVCTAALRPPVEEIMAFLQAEQDWMIPNLFGGKNLNKVAHGLAVSRTVDDFKRRVGMSASETKALKTALKAVQHDSESVLQELGMPPNAWDEVAFFFGKLIKSGFSG